MKLLSSYFVAPAFLAVLSVFAGCGSDTPTPSAAAGAAGKTTGAAGSGVAGSGVAGSGVAGSGVAGSGVAGSGVAGSGVAGASTAGSGGSSGGSAGGAAIEASYNMVKDLIHKSCFGNGCHGQEGNPLQMGDDSKLYTELTTHMTKHCGQLINKTNPAASALVKVLQGDCGTPPDNTPRMPYQTCFDGDTDPDSPCIQPPVIAAIQAWIAKGAPQQ